MSTPAEIIKNYADGGAKKTGAPAPKLLMLGALAGFLIGMGAAVTNTAAHAVGNVSAARVVCGLLFPFGLAIVMLLGGELFTGNCMLPVAVFERKATVAGMLRNWALVYCGNFAGALFTAAGCAFFGQLNYSGGGLAAYTIKVAASKCAMTPLNAAVMGVFCNLLVCAGVLCANSSDGTAGKILGAFVPVAFFVICGFEHSVANMYYVPAGLFALADAGYAAKAAELGVDAAALTWGNFFVRNLAPVTLGNIIGGAALGALMWASHLREPARPN